MRDQVHRRHAPHAGGADAEAAQAAAARAARLRQAAIAEAEAAIAAILAAQRRLGEAADLTLLRGQEAWLGPARDAFDGRCRAVVARIDAQMEELHRLRLAIEGAV